MYFMNRESYEENNKLLIQFEESVDKFLTEMAVRKPEEFINLYNEIMMIDNVSEVIQYNEAMNILEGVVKDTVKSVNGTASRVDKKVNEKYFNLVDKVKRSIVDNTRENIINQRIKITTIIKAAIGFGLAWAINPAIAVLGAFIGKAIKKGLTQREKNLILADLKRELEICEEKIKDADASGDRKKKYELMRLRNELKRNIEKVRYGRLAGVVGAADVSSNN